jgi:glutathione S-transferase
MEKQMLNEIKEFFQNFLAPQLDGIRGDIRALEAKVDAVDTKFEAKFDALDGKFEARFDALDSKFEARFVAIDSRFEAVDAKFGVVLARIDAIDTKVESFRRELLAEVHRVESSIR